MAMATLFPIFFLFLLAAGVILGAFRAGARLKNEQEMWAHRKHLAKIIHEIEVDTDAPEAATKFAACLANSAFNTDFLSRVLSEGKKASRASEERAGDSLLSVMQKEFGRSYGRKLYSGVNELSQIVLLSDLWMGCLVRHIRDAAKKTDAKKNRRSFAQSVHDVLLRNNCNNHDDGMHPA